MTAYRMVTLTCDDCGEVHDDGQSLTVAQARRTAKAEGWVRRGRTEDLCPGCGRGWTRLGNVGWTEP